MDRLLLGALVLICKLLLCNGVKLECGVTETHETFEKRECNQSVWITTKVGGTSIAQMFSAHNKLNAFCNKQANLDCSDNWPALINVTDNTVDSMAWYVPTNTTLTEVPDSDVTQLILPALCIYAREFHGTPSVANAQTSAQKLKNALEAAGKTYNSNYFIGACYSFLTPEKEIWLSCS